MKRLLLILAAAALCTAAFAPSPTRGSGQAREGKGQIRRVAKSIPGQYIVVLKEDLPGSEVAAAAADLARAHRGTLRFVYARALKGFSIELPEAAAVALSRDPRVEYVEENPQGSVITTQPNPPWGLDRIDQRDGRDTVYTYDATGAGVNAYVIDTGIRASHVDFGGRASLVADYIGDGCGDCNGHGTHVAGTIGGATYGVAKSVTLRAIKVCDAYGYCPGDVTIAGIDWVTVYHVKPAVANVSLGFPPTNSIDAAVRRSLNAGVTYAIAAGNSADNAGNYSPARVTEALTVGATDIYDTRAYFSNYGSVLDVFAPGVDVLSASAGSDTGAVSFSGTSMASPHVAGVAALYLQNNPGATPAAVNAAIVNNATPNRVIDPGPGSPNRLLYSRFAAPPTSSAGKLVPKDYDGDGRADLSIKYDDGRWRIDYASNGFGAWDATYQGYGGTEAKATPADYDGDGRADLSTKSDNGNWGIDYASNGFGAFDVIYPGYGLAESRPAPADYDGDGRADLSCHSTSTAHWRIDYAWNGYGVWDQTLYAYGYSENRETPADYDGDGRADVSVHSITQGRWAIDYAWNGFGTWNVSYAGFGYSENREVPADYDGDGRADISVRSDTYQNWVIDYAWNGLGTWDVGYNGYGGADSIPVAADYDGDGRADPSVKTSDDRWLIDYASNGFGAFDQTIILQ